MVSLLGKTFAGRVGASMLKTVGLTELIAKSKAEYLDIAVSLAKDSASLSLVRNKLIDGQENSRLFNTRLFVNELESKYKEFVRT
jgi:predicted O-linked N-acetylglucosamine transferase (SPINDLY family)